MSTTKNKNPSPKIAALLEAARRANWDAMHGPPYLRTGRYRPEDAYRDWKERERLKREQAEEAAGGERYASDQH